ncbi:serine protease snake-like isoform X2 [Zootermopsis nevadensis]|uniref:Serine protease snake n=1 Tax=Zootermopsis nevadensis TaxID=136037 RepID=A0A067QUF2_ZOONE|nr:serine protease snake-like isoform X2 [Zootermopsis nevadensis]KDR12676.1 Serine protease snake [Zootermopsis nevadensis]
METSAGLILLGIALLKVASSGVQPSEDIMLTESLCTSSDGSAGVCRALSDCPAVQDNIRYRRLPFPVFCQSKNTDQIVCCSNTRGVESMKRVCEGPDLNKSVPQEDTSRARRYSEYYAIYGGSYVIEREFPHMAAVGFLKRGQTLWLCGGSLIHKRFVLTAAHCVEDNSRYRYGKARFVRLGDTDLKSSVDDADVQMFNVARRIAHPDYRKPEKYHDIALLQLDKDVRFNNFVKPACLHTQNAVPDDMPIATGWGLTEPGRRATGKKLLKVDLEFQPMDKCSDALTKNVNPLQLKEQLGAGLLEDSMLCVGVLEGGKDSCQGDSGGPLQVMAHSPMCDFDIVGVISFGVYCAVEDIPAIYTRVSKYVPWIESIVCSYTDRS